MKKVTINKLLLSIILSNSIILADEYEFNMDEIAVKSYEYSGYIRGENRFQVLNNLDYIY